MNITACFIVFQSCIRSEKIGKKLHLHLFSSVFSWLLITTGWLHPVFYAVQLVFRGSRQSTTTEYKVLESSWNFSDPINANDLSQIVARARSIFGGERISKKLQSSLYRKKPSSCLLTIELKRFNLPFHIGVRFFGTPRMFLSFRTYFITLYYDIFFACNTFQSNFTFH